MNIKDIQKRAIKLGAGEWAVKKWRVRKKIPIEWQVKLMQDEPGVLSFSDFKRIHEEMKGEVR